MPSRADVERYREANTDVVTLAFAQLIAWWASVRDEEPAIVHQAAQVFVPQLVRTFGDVAALLAADFYDTLRHQSSATESFGAVMAEAVPVEQAQASARYAVQPLFPSTRPMPIHDPSTGDVIDYEDEYVEPDPDAARQRLEGTVQRLVLQPGRDTITANVERDPADARWARIPTGPTTCAFCLVMASRGAEYGSKESAGKWKLPDGSNPFAYHDDCDCVATPFWPGDEYPDGYDPDAFLQQYQDAADAADSRQLKPILTKLREQQGVR